MFQNPGVDVLRGPLQNFSYFLEANFLDYNYDNGESKSQGTQELPFFLTYVQVQIEYPGPHGFLI